MIVWSICNTYDCLSSSNCGKDIDLFGTTLDLTQTRQLSTPASDILVEYKRGISTSSTFGRCSNHKIELYFNNMGNIT